MARGPVQLHRLHWLKASPVDRKSAKTSPQAVELNPGISGESAAWW